MIDQKHPVNQHLILHPERPETGEWVKFKVKEGLSQDAHVCPEGYYVGIYVRMSTDAYGNVDPEHIAPVDKDGYNVFKGGQQVKLAPEDVVELHHLEDRDHIPQTRLAKSLETRPDMQTAAYWRRQEALKLKEKVDSVNKPQQQEEE